MPITIKDYNGISDDSRYVKKGDIFFAIQGARFDGRKFIDQAVKNGALAVVVPRGFKGAAGKAKVIRVDDPRAELARAACDFYNPSGKVGVIGITGTKGKTTVSHLLAEILKKAGLETGVVGTISHRWKDRIIEAKNTTPGTIELQKMLGAMASESVKYCAMEVSSHSLEQGRVAGIDFKAAIFTNIASEHMDYHKTFENYLEAKSKLFRGLSAGRLAIVNADDKNFENISRSVRAKILKYGLNENADVRAENIRIGLDKTEFTLRTRTGSFAVRSRLVGIFNVYNTLAAVSAALNEGVQPGIIQEAVAGFAGVEGRLELVDTGPADPGFKIFVDYAHTDDALKNVLETLRIMAKGRLITVFSCGGDRDRQKRPRMGNVASKFSDLVIVTSDNPRSENPVSIAKEIEKGIASGFKKYKIIIDRLEAIREAVNAASEGDIVVIAGKGHEKYQIVGDKVLPFSDKEAVKMVLGAREACLK